MGALASPGTGARYLTGLGRGGRMFDSFDLLVLAKALVAGALGFVIGWQRENSGSVAGDRTFALVSIGTAIVTAFSLATFPENADRLIGSAVTGVGFLGAGLIVRNAGGVTRGLTTAAGLWATTAIGVVVGAGHFILAVALTVLVLLVLLWEDIPLVAWLGLRNTRSPRLMHGTAQGRKRRPTLHMRMPPARIAEAPQSATPGRAHRRWSGGCSAQGTLIIPQVVAQR